MLDSENTVIAIEIGGVRTGIWGKKEESILLAPSGQPQGVGAVSEHVRSTPGQRTAGPKQGVLPGRARQLDLPPAGYRGWGIKGRKPRPGVRQSWVSPQLWHQLAVWSPNLPEIPGASNHEEYMP